MRQAHWVALLLAACGSPAPQESYYTLSTQLAAPPAVSESELSLYVGPVSVPEEVDRTQMVLRISPNQVEISDAHRWAEPLKTAIARVLAETLARELRTARVLASRQGASGPVDYRIAVEVQRFESSLDTGATIDAVWTIVPAKKGGVVRNGRTVAQEPLTSRDPQGLAAAHSRALDKVGRDIAAAIR
ncbi:MAG: PqiC family protein [Usitatibacter sp.]